MEITGERKINAKRTIVFAALNDVDILQKAIPGCEEVSKESYNEFTGAVVAKVGPIKSKFIGKASLENVLPPKSYTIMGEGKGGPAGNVKVSAQVDLKEEQLTTTISYVVNAKITGKLAQLGGPIVQKTVEKLSEKFFNNLQTILDGESEEKNDSAPELSSSASKVKPFLILVAIAALGYLTYLVI